MLILQLILIITWHRRVKGKWLPGHMNPFSWLYPLARVAQKMELTSWPCIRAPLRAGASPLAALLHSIASVPTLSHDSIYSAVIQLFGFYVFFLTERRARQHKVLLFYNSQRLSQSWAFNRCVKNVEWKYIAKVHPITTWLPRLGKQHPQCIINSAELSVVIPYKCKDRSAELVAQNSLSRPSGTEQRCVQNGT